MATTTSVSLLPEVAAFLASGPLGGVIAGRQTTSSNRETFTTVDPGSGETLAEVSAMQSDDVDRAATRMGPVVSEKQRKRVLGYLQRGQAEGAEVVLEGGEAAVPGRNGFYVKPALLAGSLDNVAAREEIFGPVAYLASFGSEDEAVEMANNTDYGLANSVWSSDLGRAYRIAEAMVAANSWVNAHNVFPHGVPYAGVNKSGMGGGVLSIQTLFDYWRSLSVVRPL